MLPASPTRLPTADANPGPGPMVDHTFHYVRHQVSSKHTQLRTLSKNSRETLIRLSSDDLESDWTIPPFFPQLFLDGGCSLCRGLSRLRFAPGSRSRSLVWREPGPRGL